MFTLFWVILAGLVVLVVSEVVRRRLHISNEDSRKTYHVVHALIMAAAPFFVSYNIIIVLQFVLLADMFVVRRLKLFSWLYEVGRVSWGDFFTVGGVVAIALMRPNKWIFLAAMLHLGIADAAAALIGTRYGKKRRFTVFGQTKSLQGSSAFLVSSVLVTLLVIIVSSSGSSSLGLLVLLPLLSTLAETASPFGSDNFVIPVLVVLVLNTLQFAP